MCTPAGHRDAQRQEVRQQTAIVAGDLKNAAVRISIVQMCAYEHRIVFAALLARTAMGHFS